MKHGLVKELKMLHGVYCAVFRLRNKREEFRAMLVNSVSISGLDFGSFGLWFINYYAKKHGCFIVKWYHEFGRSFIYTVVWEPESLIGQARKSHL